MTTRRAAKYRFHGTARSAISHASAAAPAAMEKTVRSETPDRWPSQATSSAARAPNVIIAHHLTTPLAC